MIGGVYEVSHLLKLVTVISTFIDVIIFQNLPRVWLEFCLLSICHLDHMLQWAEFLHKENFLVVSVFIVTLYNQRPGAQPFIAFSESEEFIAMVTRAYYWPILSQMNAVFTFSPRFS